MDREGDTRRIMTTLPPSYTVIAIDGPSGAGKSTAARCLAQHLGYHYVDSGAVYRAVGWTVYTHEVPLHDSAAIVALLQCTTIEVTCPHGQSAVWVNGENVTCRLRGEAVGKAASAVATQPAVRQVVTEKLRLLGRQAPLVMEGRDIGTVVFPDATIKFFLDASLEVRAQRRFQEMQQAGQGMTLDEVYHAVAMRDSQDQTRTAAPLACAPDAQVIDTTALPVDDVVRIMLSGVRHIRGESGGL